MIRRGITLLVLVCVVSAGLHAAAAAAADTPQAAIADCYQHSQLTAHYSTDTLRKALVQMPADVREYSDCFDVIEKQLFAQQGSSGGSSGTPASNTSSSGSVIPTPLLIVIILLALAAVTFGALAIRRRRGEGTDDPAQGGPDGPGGSGPAAGA